jgi:hypothetical protein
MEDTQFDRLLKKKIPLFKKEEIRGQAPTLGVLPDDIQSIIAENTAEDTLKISLSMLQDSLHESLLLEDYLSSNLKEFKVILSEEDKKDLNTDQLTIQNYILNLQSPQTPSVIRAQEIVEEEFSKEQSNSKGFLLSDLVPTRSLIQDSITYIKGFSLSDNSINIPSIPLTTDLYRLSISSLNQQIKEQRDLADEHLRQAQLAGDSQYTQDGKNVADVMSLYFEEQSRAQKLINQKVKDTLLLEAWSFEEGFFEELFSRVLDSPEGATLTKNIRNLSRELKSIRALLKDFQFLETQDWKVTRKTLNNELKRFAYREILSQAIPILETSIKAIIGPSISFLSRQSSKNPPVPGTQFLAKAISSSALHIKLRYEEVIGSIQSQIEIEYGSRSNSILKIQRRTALGRYLDALDLMIDILDKSASQVSQAIPRNLSLLHKRESPGFSGNDPEGTALKSLDGVMVDFIPGTANV